MKRFVGLFGMVALAAWVGVACSNGGSTTTGASETETPVETQTPDPTATPTGTPQQTESLRFVALGDTGKGYDQQYPVASAMNQKCIEDGCDFALMLGDNYYPSGVTSPTDPQFVDKFEQPYGGIGIPFFITLGNHDYGADGAGYEFDRGLHQVAYAQTHPLYVLPAEYYSFDEPLGTFLALGTNLIFWNYDDAPGKQNDYFSTVLDGSTAPWKIAFGHHPYVSNGKHGNAGEYDNVPFIPIANGEHIKSFVEGTLCGRVDLYIAGHDHSRQILPGPASCPDTLFVVSGAGASTTDLPGDGPSHFQSNKEGFTYFIVTPETITIQMIDAAGVIDFEYVLTH